MTHKNQQPCGWAKGEEYLRYHDQEWGVPCKDDKRLFEKLCLEGQQAGLSWITVLKKREHYRACFHNFNPFKVAKMTDEALETCLLDKGLIRNRLKIYAIRKNAQAFVAMEEQGLSLRDLVWGFVDGAVQVHHYAELAQLPAQTEASQAMSRALKKLGFSFIGATICYAFMQSMGLVNDHLTSCPLHPDNKGA